MDVFNRFIPSTTHGDHMLQWAVESLTCWILILTDGVKAVDVKARWASLSYMNLLKAVFWAVGQCHLYSHHTGLVQTGLSGEMVLGWQTFSCHVVKQLIGFHGAEGWSGNLEGHMKDHNNQVLSGLLNNAEK